MNTIIKPIIASVIAAIIVVSIGFGVYHPAPTVIEQQSSQPSGQLRGTSPEVSSPYLSVNGLLSWYYRFPMTAGTSTPCEFQTPAATTSLKFFTAYAPSTTTASVWTLATSTNINSTTTSFFDAPELSGASISLDFYPIGISLPKQDPTSTSTAIIPPSSWLVLGAAGGKSGPNLNNALYASSTGNYATSTIISGSYCQASLIQL